MAEIKRGRILHDHTPRKARTYPHFSMDKELSGSFYKAHAKAIREYEEFLNTIPDITYSKEEHASVYHPLCACGKCWACSNGLAGTTIPKTVSFTVRRIITRKRSEYCTDAEHYDPRTGHDTRDDLPAACRPDYSGIYTYRRSSRRNNFSRSTVRQHLHQASQLIPESIDELEDPVLDNRYANKAKVYDD